METTCGLWLPTDLHSSVDTTLSQQSRKSIMIKINNRVSLFNNMGKQGTVVGFQKRKNNRRNQWSTIPQSHWSNNIVIQWDDGTVSEHLPEEVMRID